MSKRKPQRGSRSTLSTRLPYVEATRGARGQEYLYYRRAGRRIPLPQPEGSSAFLRAYEAARRLIEEGDARPVERHTLDAAVTAYLASSKFAELKPRSRADYRRTLDRFRGVFGPIALTAMDEAWVDALRAKYAGDPERGVPARPIEWNALRSRMIDVVRVYRKLHPALLAANPWEATRRLAVPRSDVHRPWPPAVLLAVLRAATPEFRALLVGYLMTAQRGGDVTRFRPDQYDATAGTLRLAQEKTEKALVIHVPASLARAFAANPGRHSERLFVTPRGKPWTTNNAQETLQRLLAQLGLPRYTLHGLRKTAASALKMLGFENRAIRALTGHESDRNLEIYLSGVENYPLARAGQEALEGRFARLLAEAETGGNTRRFSGVTGRAARKRRAIANPLPTSNADPAE